MRRSDFRSTFIEALNAKELGWAEEFAAKFISKLHPEMRNDLTLYCRARLAYESKNYNEALDNAVKVNINQITFKMDIKNLLSKVYYDTNSIEPLISLLNTYKQLVRNSASKNEGYLERHTNYVKYFLKFLSNIEKRSDS